MSKLLFVHDHIFDVNENGSVYSSGCFPASVWKRYLEVFTTVTVLARGGEVNSRSDSGPLSSFEGVNFVFSKNASNLKTLITGGGEAKELISSQIRNSDAVIARLSSELGLIAIREAERQGKPWAVELVDCPWDSYWNYGTLKAKLYAPFITYRIKRSLKKSKYALYVTKTFLQQRYPAFNAVTVDCSNVEIPNVSTNVLELRLKTIEKNKNKVVLGQIASLKGRFKGIQTVMEALSYARQGLGDVEFRLLGGGDKEVWIKEATKWGVEDICYFDGVLPSGQAVFEWLDNIDIYLHPSFKEGLPRALLESMSRGCPAIASDVAGTPELLPINRMIKPGNAEDLAKKILNLSQNKEELKKDAVNNFNMAKNYTSDILDSKRTDFWSKFKCYVVKAS